MGTTPSPVAVNNFLNQTNTYTAQNSVALGRNLSYNQASSAVIGGTARLQAERNTLGLQETGAIETGVAIGLGAAAIVAAPEVGAGLATLAAGRAALSAVGKQAVGGAAKGSVFKGVPVETFERIPKRIILQNDVKAFRFSGGVSDPKGHFLTTKQTLRQITSPQDAQRVLQLPKGATAEKLNTFTIPKGTEIFVGRVKGGPSNATQIFIKDKSVLK